MTQVMGSYFDLADFDGPNADELGGSGQDSIAMVSGLAEDHFQVGESGQHSSADLCSFGLFLGARVERGVEALADPLDAVLQLVALVEGHERHHLLLLLALHRSGSNSIVH